MPRTRKLKRAPITSEIPCDICCGSKINPSHGLGCGACEGTGRSTARYHQPRNGTTIGVRCDSLANVLAADHSSQHWPTLLEAVKAQHPTMGNPKIHGATRSPADRNYWSVLVDWDNEHYPKALAHARERYPNYDEIVANMK